MRRWLFTAAAIAVLLVPLAAVTTANEKQGFRARLSGFSEVPAVSTDGSGSFSARMAEDGSEIQFRLTYADLEADPLQAHIHFGQPGVNGGVSVWLCSNLESPPTPAGVQPCPDAPASVEGTFDADDVVGPTGQGIDPGELEELLAAIRAGVAYANVHTTMFPGGEIRGQIR